MVRWLLLSLFSLGALALEANAFCGLYVAQAEGDLFNKASRVAVARKGHRTVVTMANDYQGNLSEFAIVVPVPEVIGREQVHVSNPEIFARLDSFSAPRLAEYHDDNPCAPEPTFAMYEDASSEVEQEVLDTTHSRPENAYGVTIEDEYTAGEYDIVILSAEQGGGLLEWLEENGYRLPDGAERILNSYIRTGMKFFVAKVNLTKRSESGREFLRPISIAYEDEDFALPIRLGTLNADGSQDLIAFMLSSNGRVETSNYRTRKIPTNEDVPLFIKEEAGSFREFYKALFDRQVKRAGGAGVFLEYFWDVGSCDPCAGDPPPLADLLELGVFWMDEFGGEDPLPDFETAWKEMDGELWEAEMMAEELREETYWGNDLFLTRLHIRYDARRFPEDLKFIETGDDDYFQGRYIVHVPWRGEETCYAAEDYVTQVANRQSSEFSNLVRLTGWKRKDVRARARANGDYPFSLAPKPPRAADVETPDKARAHEIYDQHFWWGYAFPDLLARPQDDSDTETPNSGDDD